MKNLTRILILLICPLFLLTCSKDKDDEENNLPPAVQGNFTVEGDSYELHDGTLNYWGTDDDVVFFYGCMLHTTGISYKRNLGYEGEGSAVVFFLASSVQGESELASFPIVYDVDVQIDQAFDVQICPGFEPGSENSYTLDYYNCTSGTVTILNKDGISNVTVEAKANKIDHETNEVLGEDIPVSVNYTGDL